MARSVVSGEKKTNIGAGCHLIISCSIISYFVLSYPVLRCPFLSCPVLSCYVLSCAVLSCAVLSCTVLSCPVLSCPVLSCPVLCCPVLLVLSCPSILSYHIALRKTYTAVLDSGRGWQSWRLWGSVWNSSIVWTRTIGFLSRPVFCNRLWHKDNFCWLCL